jgi:hypothetical protein
VRLAHHNHVLTFPHGNHGNHALLHAVPVPRDVSGIVLAVTSAMDSVSRVPTVFSLFKLKAVTEVIVATGNGLVGLVVVIMLPNKEPTDTDSDEDVVKLL